MSLRKTLNSVHRVISRSSSGRFWKVVIGFILVTRLAAVVALGEFHQPQLYEYGMIARHLLAGYGYSLVFPGLHIEFGIDGNVPQPDATPTAFTLPGYVGVMYAVLGVVGDNTTGYIVLYGLNILMGILAAWAVYLLTRMLLSEEAARWSAVLTALYPPFIAVSTTFGGALWYQVLMCFSLILIIQIARKKTLMAAVAAGIVTAVWLYFRAEALGIAALLSLWLWRKASARVAFAFFLIVALSAVPWAVRNYYAFHTFVPMTTNGWLNFWRGNNPSTSGGSYTEDGSPNWYDSNIYDQIKVIPRTRTHEIDIMRVYKAEALRFVREHPWQVARLYLKKLVMFFTIDFSDPRIRTPIFIISQGLMVFAFFWGFFILRHKGRAPWPLIICITYYALLVSALHVETRYQIMVEILFIPFSAVAVMHVFSGNAINKKSTSA
ncbi:MAG: glycosyltransferase family 39 protein [Chlorobi bacterium]|nr:glycosyltransferase family 39 protein [Chlorobiota bacterium]